MEFFATEVMEKRASGPVSGAPAPLLKPRNVMGHAAYGALPGIVGGAALGGLLGATGDGETHIFRDAALGAAAGGLATGGRAAYQAMRRRTSRLASGAHAAVNGAAIMPAVTQPKVIAQTGRKIDAPPVPPPTSA